MNWKTRQLFSDREHGIVSGLSPLNMMGGGAVSWPNYQDGTSPEEAEYLDDMLLEAPEEPSIEQRVADLATEMGISAPEARAMILNQMLEQQGLILSDEIINQFATGLITLQDALSQAVGAGAGGAALREGFTEPLQSIAQTVGAGMLGAGAGGPIQGMQDGGLALDLFEEGDQDINEPLNRMAQAVSPSIADITPTETVEETIPLTEDQGPTDVSALKQAFQQLAIQAVQAANDAIEQGAPVEQVEGPLQERLLMIDEQYRQKSGMQDTILTEEFLAQLDTLSDISAEPIAMQGGGTVPDLPPINDLDRARYKLDEAELALTRHKTLKRMSGHLGRQYDDRRKKLEAEVQTLQEIVNSLLSDASLNVPETPTDSVAKTVLPEIVLQETVTRAGELPTLDVEPALTTQGFWEEMKANAARARLGTMMSGKSKQGGILGTMDVLGQAELAGAKALGDAQESMLAQLGQTERTAALLGKPPSSTWGERDWASGSPIELENTYRAMSIKDGAPWADKFFISKELQLPPNLYPTLGTIDYNAVVKVNEKIMTFKEFYTLKRSKQINDLILIKREFDGLGPKKIYGSPGDTRKQILQKAEKAGLKSGDRFYGPDGALYEMPQK